MIRATGMGERLILVLVIATALIAAARAAGQENERAPALIPAEAGSITMRPIAVVAADQPVRLKDVAVLRGGAQELAERLIKPAPEPAPEAAPGGDRTIRIGPHEITAALGEIEGLDWSLLMLRGGACEVRLTRDAPGDATGPEVGGGGAELGRFEGFVIASAFPAGATRAHASASLATLFDVPPADLRVSFERAGAALLDADTHGLTVQAHPLGAGDRVPVRIRVFDPVGERLVRAGVVHARVEIRTRCARVRTTLRRGTVLHEDQVSIAHEWVSPSLRPAPEVIGNALRRTLESGRVVTETDVEPPLLVQRGDKVAVHCVSGAFVLRITARALDSGRRGEVIELESLEIDRRERRRFAARVSGPGEVVASADTDLTVIDTGG